ncbi:hypothetical protein GCM10025760_19900 [Microbacterium yannicii]|uniref:DUF2975 domain-containing protein n=1 Tax=Microbacterium yannicii TaxID=671622 RepID=A0ABP9M6S8_9MICO|nr:hypothetical protein [Microbacterium yannicii]MCO5952384.1 hypothetical protein [Microbacterium yannicii]
MPETTTKERNDIISTLVVAGVVAAIVVVASVVRWLETFTLEGISVPVPFAGVPADFAPADGLPVTTVRVTEGDVIAVGVNAVSTFSVGASIIVSAAAWLVVIALFGTLAVRFLRGRFFDPTNPRLLDAASWTMLGGALAVYFLDTFGRNGVLAAAGLGEFLPDSWAITASFIPIWIAAIVLGLISLAFRRGIRLQRDTDGLV